MPADIMPPAASPNPPAPTRTRSILLRLALVGWAALSLWLALMGSIEVSMAGFPDGHVTSYDAATRPPLEMIIWMTTAQAGYFLLLAVLGKRLRLASVAVQVAIAGLLTLTPMWVLQDCPRWNLCSQAYMSITGTFLDDGAGG
jgi:hypothetical protein